jgi:hypothetical protein
MPQLLASWKVTLIGSFLTTGKSLPSVFSAATGWLDLPSLGLPELLASY